MHEVRVFGLGVEMPGAQPLMLLQEVDAPQRVLPIWIGVPEAGAVEAACAHVTMPRPGTHRLIADVIDRFDRALRRVSITALRDGVFHAELQFDGDIRISARPSDAVVLAVLLQAPIDAAEVVLAEAAVDRGQVVDNTAFLDPLVAEDIEPTRLQPPGAGARRP